MAAGTGSDTSTSEQAAGQIHAWEDDPLSVSGAQPIARPVPEQVEGLTVELAGNAPPADMYAVGSTEFRYWTARDALCRGIQFWSGIVGGGMHWEVGDALGVLLDAGEDLNAYYSRGDGDVAAGLNFFHYPIAGTTVYSGESPDVVCHELGHAVLDAVRPQLFQTASAEVAAFHESFGDMSAILCDLQLESLRQAVLNETGGRLYQSCRLSRLAEQMGWALGKVRRDLAEPDCLRNAVNSFFYHDPTALPPRGPVTALASEPHSFSRVFTGAFYEALAAMLDVRAGSSPATSDQLLQVSQDMGRLLIGAASTAPVVTQFYSQIAAYILKVDASQFDSLYHDSLRSAFVHHGILSLDSAAAVFQAPRPSAVEHAGLAEGLRELRAPTHAVSSGSLFGLGSFTVRAVAAADTKGLPASPASPDLGGVPTLSHQHAADSYIVDLLRRGHLRVEIDDETHAEIGRTPGGIGRATHALVQREDGTLLLVRHVFDCGFGLE